MNANLLIDSTMSVAGGSCASTMRNSTRRRRRDDIDRLRSMCWFEYLRSAVGVTSAYALEKLIESDAFARSRDAQYHRNKWPSFRSGKHTPASSLIERADALEPGSRQIIEHPLWSALRVERPIGSRGNELLRSLGPGMIPIIFREVPGGVFRRAEFRPLLLKQIERSPSLDSLAALVIMLRESLEAADDHRTNLLVRPTFRVALAYSVACQSEPLSELMLGTCERSILRGLHVGNSVLLLDQYDLPEVVSLLRLELEIARAACPKWIAGTEAGFLLRTLTLTYDFNRLLAYLPLFGPLEPSDQKGNEHLQKTIALQQNARQALRCLLEAAAG